MSGTNTASGIELQRDQLWLVTLVKLICALLLAAESSLIVYYSRVGRDINRWEMVKNTKILASAKTFSLTAHPRWFPSLVSLIFLHKLGDL